MSEICGRMFNRNHGCCRYRVSNRGMSQKSVKAMFVRNVSDIP